MRRGLCFVSPMTTSSPMHVLIATTGALNPVPVVDFTTRLVGAAGTISVVTVVEVPRSFLTDIGSENWHPLDADDEELGGMDSQELALVARYVNERGQRHAEPMLAALRAAGVEGAPLYVEGTDAAKTISAIAADMNVDMVILGATRQIFDSGAWESVSARVMVECDRPVLVIPSTMKDTPADEDEHE